jgi:hypothetical protein
MQTYRLKWGVVLMVAVVAWVGGSTPPAGAQRARVPQTGQTTSYAPGDDGDIQAGVEWPTPRFKDMRDGTVKDNLTGLLWLQDVDCGGNNDPWLDALTFANTLASGLCGLEPIPVGCFDGILLAKILCHRSLCNESRPRESTS